MNWEVLWYIDLADWSVISPCTKAIQACINFLVGTHSFTLYVLIQLYGKSEFCKNGGFLLSGPHLLAAICYFCVHMYVTIAINSLHRATLINPLLLQNSIECYPCSIPGNSMKPFPPLRAWILSLQAEK